MSEKNGSSGAKPDVDALRAEIKQTRAELGETVQALAAKADVKARAHEAVEERKEAAREKVHELRQTAQHTATTGVEQAKRNPAIPIAAGVAVVGLLLVIRRRRS
jgi:MYXO-CTERM domain-containing protein